ncbi:MAG: DUF2063 domain-containing protein [Proteobacteria bacterium]|nr:MAG: DUF2063 domain-containing protein [Pseudomonadota bacterium]
MRWKLNLNKFRFDMTLNEVQASFLANLTSIGASHSPSPKFHTAIVNPGGERGFESYRTSYLARLRSSLSDDFPELAEALGEDAFFKLLDHYISLHPSTFSTLYEYSEQFKEFVLATQSNGERAAVDWAILLVKNRVEGNLHRSTDTLMTDDVAATRVCPNPTVQVVTTKKETALIWKLNDEILERVVDSTELRIWLSLPDAAPTIQEWKNGLKKLELDSLQLKSIVETWLDEGILSLRNSPPTPSFVEHHR